MYHMVCIYIIYIYGKKNSIPMAMSSKIIFGSTS